jgi:hypothetical protein
MWKKEMPQETLFVGMAVWSASTGQGREDKDASAAGKRIQEALAKLAKGGGEWKRLSVTYDDIHGWSLLLFLRFSIPVILLLSSIIS